MDDFISLYKVEFDTQKNWSIDFNTPAQRDAFFASRLVRTIEGISVVNDFTQITFSGSYLAAEAVNYCRFSVTLPNSQVENALTRIYYAYVTNVRWGGVGIVIADIEIDYIQTYLFQYNVKGYVMRAHVRENDGYLMTPESGITFRDTDNIDSDESVGVSLESDDEKGDTFPILFTFITSAKALFGVSIQGWAGAYGGAHYVYVVPYIPPTALPINGATIKINGVVVKTFNELVNEGLLTNIDVLGIYASPVIPGYHPQYGIVSAESAGSNSYNLVIPTLINSGAGVCVPLWDTANIENEILDFTVRETTLSLIGDENIYAKIATTPYTRYYLDLLDAEPVEVIVGDALALAELTISNNVYRRFLPCKIKAYIAVTDTLKSAYYCAPVSEANGRAFNGAARDNMVVSNAAEELPLLSDKYIEYQRLRRANTLAGAASGVMGAVGGIIGGTVAGNPLALVGGAASIGKTIADVALNEKQLKQQPRTVRKGGNNFAFDLLSENIYCHFIRKKYEFSNAFDVFNHYGYTINASADIDIKCRKYFNYIEYSSAVVSGDIPAAAKLEIKNRYEEGITFWHIQPDGTVNIGDYSQKNIEVPANG